MLTDRQTDRQTGELTGYPSIDKPWLKYYTKEVSYKPSPEMSMYDFLYENNKDNLDYTALNYYGKKVTYRKLFENIDTVASSLKALGIKNGDIVSVCALNTPEFVFLLYAINKIGAVSNWIGLTSPVSDLNKQLVSTKCRTVFTVNIAYDQIVEAAKDTLVDQIILVPLEYSMPAHLKFVVGLKNRTIKKAGISWKNFLNNTNEGNEISSIDPNGMALIEYTGGSTGVPKGVMLSNKAMNSYYVNFAKTNHNGIMKYSEREKFLSGVPLFLAFGASSCCHGPLCHSLELILAPDPSPEAGSRIIIKNKVNHIIGGRLLIDAIAEEGHKKDYELSFIKSIMYGGEEADRNWENSVIERLMRNKVKAPIRNGYGMTETAAAIMVVLNKETEGLIPFGNVNVKIVNPDDESQEYKYNTEGELCLSADTLMLGYYNNDKATKDSIFEKNGVRWLKTKDLATITPDGVIKITGRIKRIYSRVDSEGIQTRVYPMRIEETLTEHDLVKQSAVIGIKDDVLAYRSVAYIIPSVKGINDNDMKQQLQKHCKANLPDSHQPDEYIFVDKFPITRAGKVDYKDLERRTK